MNDVPKCKLRPTRTFGLKGQDMTAQGKASELRELAAALGTQTKTSTKPRKGEIRLWQMNDEYSALSGLTK